MEELLTTGSCVPTGSSVPTGSCIPKGSSCEDHNRMMTGGSIPKVGSSAWLKEQEQQVLDLALAVAHDGRVEVISRAQSQHRSCPFP